ncbi:MAG: transcriptional regulator, TetR family [Microbacteriaceae bacterium]|jgi:DNA-binding transcriptional regulator YbjK|nr:transcriptional regulator, TetR family [Microbacteriaceae bacterium]
MSDDDGRLARGAVRRRLLLDAAMQVVASGGSGSLTHRAVAAQAHVSVASVTYHFPSIGELRRETLEYAGSGIGLELADLVLAAAGRIDDIPEICAEFAVRLVTERRIETAAVFELIVAAGHNEELRPVVAIYNSRLADLLAPYEGDRGRASTVGAAIQGLLLEQLARATSSESHHLRRDVADLIRRYRVEA